VVHAALNSRLFYAIADCMNLPLSVKNGRVVGEKAISIPIGVMAYEMPLTAIESSFDDQSAVVLVQGPGELQFLVHVQQETFLGPTQTTIFILAKSRQSHTEAFSSLTNPPTLQALKELYGPIAVYSASRESIGNEPGNWVPHR
jgi:hypothetical protein